MLSDEALIRLSGFAAVFVGLALWEWRAPRRAQEIARWRRWPGNLGILIVDTLASRVLFPLAAAGFAVLAQARAWGLFNQIALPVWSEILIAIMVLDLIIYLQHVAFHAFPGLWRLHRMHHTDLEFDVTTGVRFHPFEIIASMLIKAVAIVALGAPPVAVIVFEIVLNSASMFNHSNVRLPFGVDRVLRRVLVTPDMHRVHHSIVARETNANFGFCLPWWDWMFGTYRAQPAMGHDAMTIGVASFRDLRELRLDRMLLQPLRRDSGPGGTEQ